MSENWNTSLEHQLTSLKGGETQTVSNLDDARNVIASAGAAADPAIVKAARTAISKAAASGEPSDLRLATEQITILLRSLGWT